MSKAKIIAFPRRRGKPEPVSKHILPILKRLLIHGYCRGSLSAEFVAEQFDLFDLRGAKQ